jgi:hypothetical protein
MLRRLAAAALVFAGCASSTVTNSGAFDVGADNDPVVRMAQQSLVQNLDTCLAGTTQGPRRLLFDDFADARGTSPNWPMNDGYHAEFNADWFTEGGWAKAANPTWQGADRDAPPRPVTSGLVKFMDVCPLPETRLSLTIEADTRAATDDISDATMVLYLFDESANLLEVKASHALRRGNLKTLGLYDVAIPMAARRIAVVPMIRLGPTETQTVGFDDLTVRVEAPVSTAASVEQRESFSASETGAYGALQPVGWAEWGADFFVFDGKWVTVWNGAWGGNPNSVPPFTGAATKSVSLAGLAQPGDLLTASVLSANTFKDPASFSMLRLTFDTGQVVESDKLYGTAWSSLDVRRVRIPAGATSVRQDLVVHFGAQETSSLYFDDLVLKAEKPVLLARAAKTYSPGRNYNAVLELDSPALVDVPAELLIDTASYAGAAAPWSVGAGNAGNHTADIVYVTSAATVTCSYRGGSSQANPSGATQIALGRRYLFTGCSNGALSGTRVSASGVTVRVNNGASSYPSTRIAVSLGYSLQ